MRIRQILFLITLPMTVIGGLAQDTHNPPPPDAIAIYRDVLAHYFDGERKFTINLARYTSALKPGSESDACGKDFVAAAGGPAFDLSLAPSFGENVILVDPKTHRQADPGDAIRRGDSVDAAVTRGFAAALFTLSEVTFAVDGKHAAVEYSFVCGRLCANGGVLLYDRVGNTWKRNKRMCGGWVS